MPRHSTENNSPSNLGLTTDESAELVDGARWLRRITNPFVDLNIILSIGAAGSPTTAGGAARTQEASVRDHSKKLTDVQRKIYVEDFDEITRRLPFLKQRLASEETTTAQLKKIIHRVQQLADSARQDDTKGVKRDIAILIPQRYFPQAENGETSMNAHPHIKHKNPGTIKSWHGWGNVMTARLLCPIEHVAEFNANPDETRGKLKNNTLKLLDRNGDPKFPAFLYDEEVAGGSLAQGLFRGPFLLAVYTRMFISPSAAAGGKGNSKPGNARIHGMDKVLPSTICYAAIQAYITLSSSETWSESWKGVKLSRLYSLLREQFIHPEDPWCVETINWWNEKIFGSSLGTDEDSEEALQDMQAPTMEERLNNERQGRVQTAASVQGG